VSWQYLANNNIGPLNPTNLAKYDQLMQACFATGAYCAIDIHNFARWNNAIIGQGGPSDAQFAGLWSQLATKYASNQKVIFGLMNEPHDVDINIWANTCQAAVTAIRNAGATTQMILLPGNNFASAGQFVPNGSGAALIKITNPDGSNTGLILDVHKYLDFDNSGEHNTCTTDNIADAFSVVAQFLRQTGRLAMVSETGAGSDSSCFTDFCAHNTYLNQNSDVFLGYIAWGAGSFSTGYALDLTPTKQGGKLVDMPLCSQCVVAPWLSAGPATFTGSVSSVQTAAAASMSGQSGGVLSTSTNTGTTTMQGSSMTGSSVQSTQETSLASGVIVSGSSNVTLSRLPSSATASATQKTSTNAAARMSLACGLFAAAFLFAVLLL